MKTNWFKVAVVMLKALVAVAVAHSSVGRAQELAPLMQAAFTQQLSPAQQQQVLTRDSLSGDWLYLAALVQLDLGNYRAGQQLLRNYLQLPQSNVHRLKARSLFNSLRRFGARQGFADYYQLWRLRDADDLAELQQRLRQFLASDADPMLIAKARLLQAHALLEMENRPKPALTLYRKLITEFERGDDLYAAHLGAIYCLHRLGRLSQAKKQAESMQQALDGGWFANDDLLSRSWQLRLDASKLLLQQPAKPLTPLLWGSGSRLNIDRPAGSGHNHRPLWRQPPLTEFAGQSLTLWITRHSDWRWLQSDLLTMATKAGYTPMISLWYFGDEISPEFVTEHWQPYLEMIQQRLIPLLRTLPQAYLLLEPEFNKNGIESWPDWDRRMSQVVALIKQQLPNVKVGLVLGDWDGTGQQSSYETSLMTIEQSDFIGSMLMIANYTESAHSDPDWSPWIRSLRLGQQLQQRFAKPWMLAYAAIASAPNWQRRQRLELDKLQAYLPQLRGYGLFAINWFSAVDEPAQIGWFADAETSFGLLDANYQPKLAFERWQQLAEAPMLLPSMDAQPAQLTEFQIQTGRSSAEFQFHFDRWQRWQMRVSKGDEVLWQQQGAGDSATLFWDNYSGVGGNFSASLQWQQQQQTASFQLPIGRISHPRFAPAAKSLMQWQQLWLTPLQRFRHASFTLGSDRPLDDQLEIALIDSNGAMRSARLLAYAIGEEGDYRVQFDSQQLAEGWRRYQGEQGVIWSEQAVGEINLVLINSSAEPIELTVTDLRLW
ncbi:tetratricopeptide repeat protein [Ferrimonas senticii]|uniref:tetratricopeptide repeat protein n=1 Tax=Ferrimonas senticii TaxID=394566 RepID=UPI0004809137|nr:hypothetical protein [Ferrimonas senticii]